MLSEIFISVAGPMVNVYYCYCFFFVFLFSGFLRGLRFWAVWISFVREVNEINLSLLPKPSNRKVN